MKWIYVLLPLAACILSIVGANLDGGLSTFFLMVGGLLAGHIVSARIFAECRLAIGITKGR